ASAIRASGDMLVSSITPTRIAQKGKARRKFGWPPAGFLFMRAPEHKSGVRGSVCGRFAAPESPASDFHSKGRLPTLRSIGRDSVTNRSAVSEPRDTVDALIGVHDHGDAAVRFEY